MSSPKPHLCADDWLRAGLRALVASGPQALKAEPLARALKTTKGSFYWHFKDVEDFHTRLSGYWERSAVAALTQAVNTGATPTERLHRIAAIMVPDEAAASEPAIRAWAQENHTVANAVAEVDSARLAYIHTVLEGLGLTNPDFARLLYGALLGMQVLPGGAAQNDSALSTLTAALLALQKA